MQRLTVPEIAEVLMSEAEDACMVCAAGHDVTVDDRSVWHVRDGVRRECRAHQIHRAIKRFEQLEDAG
jgi:hypothetical protein